MLLLGFFKKRKLKSHVTIVGRLMHNVFSNSNINVDMHALSDIETEANCKRFDTLLQICKFWYTVVNDIEKSGL